MKAYYYESVEVQDLEVIYYNVLADLDLYYSESLKAYFSVEPYESELSLIYDNGERDDSSAIALFNSLCDELLNDEPTGWGSDEIERFEKEINLYLNQL